MRLSAPLTGTSEVLHMSRTSVLLKHVTIDFEKVLISLSTDLGLDHSSVSYMRKRLRFEGISFATVTLPKLVKAVLKGVSCGWFYHKNPAFDLRPTQFAWKSRSLVLFTSLLKRIFDDQGFLNKDTEVVADALRVIRSVCEYMYKLATSFQPHQLRKAEQDYIEREQLNARNLSNLDPSWCDALRRNFEKYYPRCSRALPHQILESFRPRFTAGAFYGSERYVQPFCEVKLWPDTRIGTCSTEFRAFSGYFKPYPSAPLRVSVVREQRNCKVLFVPKDSRGPRVISKEPLHLLRAQMSYFDFLSKTLQQETAGRVNFTDQEVNKRLAQEASIDGSRATIDLKEASDSVLYTLVNRVFRNSPGVRYFIANTRSTHAELPSGKTVLLNKLAGMGSGLTFPTMALIIHLSVCTHVSRVLQIPYCSVSKEVYVYGDDLIVPSLWYTLSREALGFSQLCVNEDKSFATGNFRESCGGDYYGGREVTPVRLKLTSADLPTPDRLKNRSSRRWSARLGDAGALQLERHCRELVTRGMYTLSEYYYECLERHFGRLPTVSGKSPLIGRYDDPSRVSLMHEKAWYPVPFRIESSDYCPYKYLGQVLGGSTQEAARAVILGENPVQRLYGELAVPRKVRLLRRLVSHVQKF
jgi:hypothetical protein